MVASLVRQRLRLRWNYYRQIQPILGWGMALAYLAGTSTIRPKAAAHRLFIRKGTSDSDVFKQIFIKQEYECFKLGDGLIVDCGAYVGYSAAYFLSRYPDAPSLRLNRIVAISHNSPRTFGLMAIALFCSMQACGHTLLRWQFARIAMVGLGHDRFMKTPAASLKAWKLARYSPAPVIAEYPF